MHHSECKGEGSKGLVRKSPAGAASLHMHDRSAFGLSPVMGWYPEISLPCMFCQSRFSNGCMGL